MLTHAYISRNDSFWAFGFVRRVFAVCKDLVAKTFCSIMGNSSAFGNSSVSIELDRPDCLFLAGEPVTGRIRLVAAQETNLRGIYLMHRCNASMYYVVRSNKNSTTYTGAKVYEEQPLTVFGSYTPGVPSTENAVLPVGTVEYPFTIETRAAVPGTVEIRKKFHQSTYRGSILHSLHVTVDVGTNQRISAERSIVICSSRHLASPDLLRPIGYVSRPVSLCFSRGSFSIEAKLTRQAFAAGEALDFYVRVNNNTSKSLSLKVELICAQLLRSDSVWKKTFPVQIEDTMYSDTVEPQKVYEIFHDTCGRNLCSAQVEDANLNSARKIFVPKVPTSFNGAPGTATGGSVDPVTFAYSVKFTAGTMGCCSTRRSVTIAV